MPYTLLPQILKQEGRQFYDLSRKWQPKDLIPDPYRRDLLKDAQKRFKQISAAEGELQTLERAHMYVKILRRMRLTVRDAEFAWRFDDLKFLNAISRFMSDYGTVLRYLKDDFSSGRFKPNEGV